MLNRYCDWEIIKDGFSFSKDAYNTLGNLIIHENEWCDSVGGRFRAPVRPIEDYIQYINKNQIQSADVYMRDLSFLKECPSLTRLSLHYPVGFAEKMDYIHTTVRSACYRRIKLSSDNRYRIRRIL